MPDITGENRDENGRFAPGISGNPSGRPKSTVSIKVAVKQKLEEIPEGEKETYLELIAKKVIEKALKGESNIIRLIWEQIDGRARQAVEVSNTGFSLTDLFNRVEEEEEKEKRRKEEEEKQGVVEAN